MTNIFAAWRSGRTVRKHTMHVQRRENTAEHTWGASLLLAKYFPAARKEVHVFVTLHDVGESGVCDVPLHVFDAVPELREVIQKREAAHIVSLMHGPFDMSLDDLGLTHDELLLVEIVDRAEFVLSCLYDYEMGNRLVLRPLFHGLAKAFSATAKIEDYDLRALADNLCDDLASVTKGANELYMEILND